MQDIDAVINASSKFFDFSQKFEIYNDLIINCNFKFFLNKRSFFFKKLFVLIFYYLS